MMNSSSLSQADFLVKTAVGLIGVMAVADAAFGDIFGALCAAGLCVLLVFAALRLARAKASVRQICAALEQAALGDLESRVLLSAENGDLLRLGDNLNRSLDVIDAFTREASATLACVRDGLLHRRIVERGLPGTFAVAAKTMNEAVATIRARLQQFSQVIVEFEQTVGGVTGAVSQEVGALSGAASAMRAHASDTQARSDMITARAGETSTSVSTVASASEQLTASAAEIAEQTSKALFISRDAEERAALAQQLVEELVGAVSGIVGVVDLIRHISQQTRTLALNANIEAARAGESGQGFAVVAREVKVLATQTAQATDEIREKISAVEQKADSCLGSIREIAHTACKVVEIATAISAATQQQTAATKEIAYTMNVVTAATNDVTVNAEEVTRAAGQSDEAASSVAEISGALSTQSNRLGASVVSFLAKAKEVANVNAKKRAS